MRLLTALFTCSLLLMVPLLGLTHPAQTPQQNKLVFVEQTDRPGVGFNWKNVTCPLCKAVFAILDIALLVMFRYLRKL